MDILTTKVKDIEMMPEILDASSDYVVSNIMRYYRNASGYTLVVKYNDRVLMIFKFCDDRISVKIDGITTTSDCAIIAEKTIAELYGYRSPKRAFLR